VAKKKKSNNSSSVVARKEEETTIDSKVQETDESLYTSLETSFPDVEASGKVSLEDETVIEEDPVEENPIIKEETVEESDTVIEDKDETVIEEDPVEENPIIKEETVVESEEVVVETDEVPPVVEELKETIEISKAPENVLDLNGHINATVRGVTGRSGKGEYSVEELLRFQFVYPNCQILVADNLKRPFLVLLKTVGSLDKLPSINHTIRANAVRRFSVVNKISIIANA